MFSQAYNTYNFKKSYGATVEKRSAYRSCSKMVGRNLPRIVPSHRVRHNEPSWGVSYRPSMSLTHHLCLSEELGVLVRPSRGLRVLLRAPLRAHLVVRHRPLWYSIDLQLYIKYAPYIFLKYIVLQLYTWKYTEIKFICRCNCRMQLPWCTNVDLQLLNTMLY
jgi:hypothetical protein